MDAFREHQDDIALQPTDDNQALQQQVMCMTELQLHGKTGSSTPPSFWPQGSSLGSCTKKTDFKYHGDPLFSLD